MTIDLHSHILPAADHGSDGLETSLRQLALAKEAGIDLLAVTPHYYPRQESAEAFLTRRAQAWEELCRAKTEDSPRLLLGSETRLCRGLHHMPELEHLCFEGTRVLLLELPGDFYLSSYESTLEGLIYERKLTVILAHIDRYPPQISDFLMELGFYAQLNAEGFCRMRTRRRCMDWAENPRVAALGSDLHGTHIGYRDFLRARDRLGPRYSPLMERTKALLGL